MKSSKLQLTNKEQRLETIFAELQDVMRGTWIGNSDPFVLIISAVSVGENDALIAYTNKPVVKLSTEDYERLSLNGKLLPVEAASCGTGSVVVLAIND